MALGVGTRLSTYEITGTLGAGGMGEVYRAKDTALEREVAIKVLPESFATDANRVARFEQEAKTLASLNHPNIAHIYGLERSEATTALVMELVEGPTLADRIAQGPLPPDEALHVAMQIVDALEAAHARGIVHRDLKPANIKLTPDGTVKVLDFGIAKALDVRPTSGPQAPALTTPAMTQAGIVLGTAAYMAPEQARGKAVDQRADIWAFGCVLYEMLTGQPAFGGEDVTITLARVLERDTNLGSLPHALSPAVKHTIKLCLAKDPGQRLHAMGDVRLALEGRLESELPRAAAQAHSPRSFWRRALPTTAAVIATGLVVGAAVWLATRPAPRPVNRFDYLVPTDQTFRGGGRPVFALSPDGRNFVYNTSRGLFVRSLDQLDARVISGTEETMNGPFFSADGQSVGYAALQGSQPGSSAGVAVVLKRVFLKGAASVVICSIKDNLNGATWEPDGTILFGQSDGIYRVSANGGVPERVIPTESQGEILYGPSLLPASDSVLVSRKVKTPDWDMAEIDAYSLSSGKRTVLVQRGTDARYLPTGHLVYVLGNTLFGVAFDAKTLTVSGSPVPLVQSVGRASGNATGAANLGVSDDGTLAYLTATSDARKSTVVWVDRDGREQPLGVPPRNYQYAQLSPDGTRVALDSRDEDNDIWIFDLAHGAMQRFTFDLGLNRSPVWSPDGSHLAFTRQLEGGEGAYWQAANGSGVPQALTKTSPPLAQVPYPSDFSPDGSKLLYSEAIFGVGMVSTDGTLDDTSLIATSANEFNPAVSPDGRWLAYQSNESGRHEIYVRPFPAVDTGRWQVSTNGGTRPLWRRDGRELFFFTQDTDNDSTVMAAAIEPGESFRFDAPRPLIHGDYLAPNDLRGIYDVSADGQRFLMIKRAGGDAATQAAQIVIVQNWFEELKRLVPTN